jgi:hypothetical protein
MLLQVKEETVASLFIERNLFHLADLMVVAADVAEM